MICRKKAGKVRVVGVACGLRCLSFMNRRGGSSSNRRAKNQKTKEPTMKVRAQKKMLKKMAKQHTQAAAKTAHKLVDSITPSSKTRVETMHTIASGAASLASLLGGAWAVVNSDVARDLFNDVKVLRRRNDFGKSAGTWIAIGAGAAAVATGVAFFLGTQSGQKVREQVSALAKPYVEKAIATAQEVRGEIVQKNADGRVVTNSIS
jgi:hypothetical protein